ncbi:MAG TPA: DUF2993 domain-containing protein [Nocardioidaceae bacterium]|nr:DUF2993 domain-containing protein [Nocardioidaceae bacterium]
MRRLLVGLGVLAILLVGADRGAKYVVEGRLADHIESKESVSGVDVSIAGFPFLTQVVGNHFDQVDVTLPEFDARNSAALIDVQDVHVSFRDVATSNRYTRATAASATGAGLVPYSEFDQFAPVKVTYGGTSSSGDAYLSVSAPSLGPGAIRVVPSAADNLGLKLDSLSVVSAVLPRSLRTFVSASHDFGGLPSGISVKRLEATPDGLKVTLVGRHVTVAK